jgi:L-ascorbate metabolism protein UlaG (beta-lactamase superfamily)
LSYTYESNISRYTYQYLPESIDYVVITHNHQDHVLFETLLQIRNKVKNIIVPINSGGFLQYPSLELILENIGFSNVLALAQMESAGFGNGSITALPFWGEHSDLHVQCKAAHLVRIGNRSLLFAADSCNLEPRLYEHLYLEVGNVDAIFLGMECDGAPLSWLYGPLLTKKIERATDESRRLAGSNYEQAIDLVQRFKAKETYVYAMGQEPWLNLIMSLKYSEESRPIVESNRLIKGCTEYGIYAERLFGEKEILIEDIN